MRSIILNNKIIQYDVKYNAKKNVNIQIKPDLTVKVSAPRWVLKGELERILNQKSSWILNNLEKQKQIQKETKVNILENGHSIWYRGNKYRLYYRQNDTNFVFVGDDQIIVFTKKADDLEYSQNIFKEWLKSNASIEFEQALQKYRNKMIKYYNIPNYSLQIRSMKTRWGTCTPAKKKITLNLNLMYAPYEYTEYVALHELTHFLEIYHNKHFYEIMQEFMPDYKIRQEILNKEFGQIAKG